MGGGSSIPKEVFVKEAYDIPQPKFLRNWHRKTSWNPLLANISNILRGNQDESFYFCDFF